MVMMVEKGKVAQLSSSHSVCWFQLFHFAVLVSRTSQAVRIWHSKNITISGYLLTDGGFDLFSIFEAFSGDCLQLFLLQFRNQLGNLRQKVIEMVGWLSVHLTSLSVYIRKERSSYGESTSPSSNLVILKRQTWLSIQNKCSAMFSLTFIFPHQSPSELGVLVGWPIRFTPKSPTCEKTRSENVVIN